MWVVELNRGICRRLERGGDGRIAGGIGNFGGVSGGERREPPCAAVQPLLIRSADQGSWRAEWLSAKRSGGWPAGRAGWSRTDTAS